MVLVENAWRGSRREKLETPPLVAAVSAMIRDIILYAMTVWAIVLFVVVLLNVHRT